MLRLYVVLSQLLVKRLFRQKTDGFIKRHISEEGRYGFGIYFLLRYTVTLNKVSILLIVVISSCMCRLNQGEHFFRVVNNIITLD